MVKHLVDSGSDLNVECGVHQLFLDCFIRSKDQLTVLSFSYSWDKLTSILNSKFTINSRVGRYHGI